MILVHTYIEHLYSHSHFIDDEGMNDKLEDIKARYHALTNGNNEQKSQDSEDEDYNREWWRLEKAIENKNFNKWQKFIVRVLQIKGLDEMIPVIVAIKIADEFHCFGNMVRATAQLSRKEGKLYFHKRLPYWVSPLQSYVIYGLIHGYDDQVLCVSEYRTQDWDASEDEEADDESEDEEDSDDSKQQSGEEDDQEIEETD